MQLMQLLALVVKTMFWGSREGYETLLNTNLKQELDQFAQFLQMAVDYKEDYLRTIPIEPKLREPTKHQYDHDSRQLFLSYVNMV